MDRILMWRGEYFMGGVGWVDECVGDPMVYWGRF
jgi:hypothetical protein